MNDSLTAADVLLWAVLPYVTIAVFVVGLVWRYRYDAFGWTTRSSQLYERRLLRIASPILPRLPLRVVGSRTSSPRSSVPSSRRVSVRWCRRPNRDA